MLHCEDIAAKAQEPIHVSEPNVSTSDKQIITQIKNVFIKKIINKYYVQRKIVRIYYIKKLEFLNKSREKPRGFEKLTIFCSNHPWIKIQYFCTGLNITIEPFDL